MVQLRFQKQHAAVENRRLITGCEAARAVLDAMGHASASVEVLEPVNSSPSSRTKELLLPAAVYHGKSLKDLVRSVRAALFFINPRPWVISGDFPEGAASWVSYAGLAAWAALPFSLGIGGEFLEKASSVFLIGMFILGIFSFLSEWEIAETAMQVVKKMQVLEVDEQVRFKKIIHGYRFGGLSVFFRAPAYWRQASGNRVDRA